MTQKATKVYCDNCGGFHSTDWQRGICETTRQIEAMKGTPHQLQGSKEVWFPDLEKYHDYMWKNVQAVIVVRDAYTCQDCGFQQKFVNANDGSISYSAQGLEVHHIIPRGMGGTDHPANLKLVCKDCHSKYNERFNGKIISTKAKERKVKRIRDSNQSLEEFA